uniref:SH2 domain containing 6 n=1 Tax=Nothobranchius furzeri TaxID=105023 RepID=A0A1A8U053_NOTFU
MRNLNSGPPAPPRRTEIRAGFEWPQEEFDDEDGDMYEVPPCERAPLKAPSSQGQENIYLERSSNPTAQQRGEKDWFAGDCSRKEAEELLQRYKKDGVFLIRHSSNQSSTQPYTLAMLYQQKVYNIPVRFLEETQSYALGKEGKKNEEVFSSLDEMVSYHRKNQILLIDSRSQAKHTANLTQAARS